jgi:hypothetical protein
VRFAKHLLVASISILLCIASTFSESQRPIGIRPDSPQGKGVIALKAARLIDGTGAPPINNAIIIVTDNKITTVVRPGPCEFPLRRKSSISAM